MKRIFIGGMGRSGTTILLHALYHHRDIFAVPIETKFLTEEDGFDDLITALTSRFSPALATAAFERFQELMYRHATGLVDSKFRQLEHLPGDVFPGYAAALDEFMGQFPGKPKYFPSRDALLAWTRRFIAALFDAATICAEKSIWVEKTPANFWRLTFLRELWPDCYFVHAIRDPRAIFLSLMERGWLPGDMSRALTIFESQMAALLSLRRRYMRDIRFTEVRLEALLAAPQTTLDELAGALEVNPFEPRETAAAVMSMDAYYATRGPLQICLNAAQRQAMEEQLLPAVTELGYPRCWQPR